MLVMDIHSSLLDPYVSYKKYSVVNTAPGSKSFDNQ